MNFGPHDPVSDVEHLLDNLSMLDNHKITKYVVKFNCYASQVHSYGEGALQHHFYNRLPEWLKDKIARVGKPYSLHDMHVRAHPRPGAYTTSGYLWSSDISMRGHSRGTDPC